jgi:hypothetical protein
VMILAGDERSFVGMMRRFTQRRSSSLQVNCRSRHLPDGLNDAWTPVPLSCGPTGKRARPAAKQSDRTHSAGERHLRPMEPSDACHAVQRALGGFLKEKGADARIEITPHPHIRNRPTAEGVPREHPVVQTLARWHAEELGRPAGVGSGKRLGAHRMPQICWTLAFELSPTDRGLSTSGQW